jgi:excisionase family DNA binding protein
MSIEERLQTLQDDMQIVKASISNKGNENLTELLTIEQTANMLSCSKQYLYQLTHKNEIPFYKPTGKLLFFKRSEVEKFIFETVNSKDRLQSEVDTYLATPKKRRGN